MRKIKLSKKKIQHRMIDLELDWITLAKKMNCSVAANSKRAITSWPIETAGQKLAEVLQCDLAELV